MKFLKTLKIGAVPLPAFAAGCVVGLALIQASASTLTSNTLTNAISYGFSDGPAQQTGGPLTNLLGSTKVTFTSSNDNALYDHLGDYALGSNGKWTGARKGFAALNAPNGDLTFTFATPVSGVGANINYDPGKGDLVLSIIGAGGRILESFDVGSAAPISTSGDDQADFRGFARDAADIFGFTASGAGVAIDDLTISEDDPTNQIQPVLATIPVPAGMPLLLAGLAALGLAKRRKG